MIIPLKQNLKQSAPRDVNISYGLAMINKIPHENMRYFNVHGETKHKNYMGYLESCWANHYAPVVKPDDIWYTLLCELSLLVAEKPETYREIFSRSKDKQEIIVYTDDTVVMPLDSLVEEMAKYVPTDRDTFLPVFSTSTQKSRFAFYAAFADMCSPYYNYGMMLCGFPYIDVRGNLEDWKNLLAKWRKLPTLLKANSKQYFERVENILEAATNAFEQKDTEFWGNIFGDKRCGSGGQTEVFGWFTKLFKKQPSVKYASNYSTHVSKVKYKNLTTNKEYEMFYGMFSSNIVGDKLEPEYGSVVFEAGVVPPKNKDDMDFVITSYELKKR